MLGVSFLGPSTDDLPRLLERLLPPNALTFHLDRLREVGLVTVRRDGRSMIYTARFEAMNALIAYLTDHCCQRHPELCKPKRRIGERKKPELVR
jgi:DNA-binding transcriptional ArsR family regulator